MIPTDFSENAWNAVSYGIQFLWEKSTVYLLHVNALPVYSGAGSSITASSRLLEDTRAMENRRAMEKLLLQIKSVPVVDGHAFLPVTLTDYLVEGVKREVEDRQIDLIIMGTKGASGLKKMALGSNTGDVITRVKCPLLAVPENAVFRSPREIAFVTDYEMGYDFRILDDLLSVVKAHHAWLRILHIQRQGEELSQIQRANRDVLNDYFQEVPHTFHNLHNSNLDAAIQCFVESRDIDLVAMVAKNLNFFERILFRPTVEEVSYHTDIPFLVLHE